MKSMSHIFLKHIFLFWIQGTRGPISKHKPTSAAVHAMPNSLRLRNTLEEALEDGDYSKYYSESTELKPFNFYPSSYTAASNEE